MKIEKCFINNEPFYKITGFNGSFDELEKAVSEYEKVNEDKIKKYTIDMKLPSLNDYIRVCRCNKYQAAKYKADIEEKIGWYINCMPEYKKPVKIHFHWIEGNKKRDLDNICFSKKFILDAMQKFGKLENDNRKNVYGFTDTFEYGDETKVILEVQECEKEF